MPKLLPRMDIAHVDLDERDLHGQQRIAQRDRVVRQAAGVDDDGVDVVVAGGMDAVDEGALVVGLEGVEGGAEGGCEGLEGGFEGG